MRDQEIVDLMEAYSSIYSAQEELAEEVEIAAQYFYEMGLNENGVDILIEDLGIEEFAEFVCDIAKEHVLVEARAGGVRIEPKTKAGKSVGQLKGGAKTAAINRLRKEKEARRSAEASASASEPSGMKASLQRQSAIANARKNQSNSGGAQKSIAGRIGAALGSAVKKAKQDIELTKKTAQTVGKAAKVGIEAMNRASDTRLARQARVATHKGVKRHTQALRAAGSSLGKTLGASAARRSSQREEVELWVNSLIEEGYDLSEYTWDDMYEIYMEEVEKLDEDAKYDRNRRRAAQRAAARNEARRQGKTGAVPGVGYVTPRPERETYTDSAGVERHTSGARMPKNEEVEQLGEGRRTSLSALSRESQQRKADKERGRPETESEIHGRLMLGKFRPGASKEERAEGGRQRLKDRGKVPQKGGKDMFEHILEHLVAEGYADTNEAALVIMANMSEEWRQSIVEETRRTEYLQKKFNKENERKSGSAHEYIPGKQNTGQALQNARKSERHMSGDR
jgi:hypothetical protein